MSNSIVEMKVEAGKAFTLKDIATDLNSGHYSALYFATENQIETLIDQGKIDEDFSARHFDYQEEMSAMMAELS